MIFIKSNLSSYLNCKAHMERRQRVILPPPPSTPPRDRWGGGWDEVLPQQFSRKLALIWRTFRFHFVFIQSLLVS